MTEGARKRDGRVQMSVGWNAIAQIATPIFSILAALLLSAIILAALGANVVTAGEAMYEGAFGSANSLGTTIAKTCPLLLAGVGIAFALRGNFYNIGAEGQIYIGGLTATVAILSLSASGLPGLLLGLACGAIGGALWGGISGALKAYRGVNEVITTLLLNYVGIQIVLWAVSGPLFAEGATFPRSADIPSDALLPNLIPASQGHAGIIFALILAVAFWWLLRNTTLGFRVRSLQEGADTPRYAGMRVQQLTVGILATSGGLAGVAGAVEILGVHRRLVEGFSPGYGFDALAVALLARGNPLAVIPAAVFFGVLRAGANAMQRATGVPSSMVFVIQGSAVLIVIAGYSIETILRKRRKARAAIAAQSSATA